MAREPKDMPLVGREHLAVKTHGIALDRSSHIGLVDIDGWSEASTGKYERWI